MQILVNGDPYHSPAALTVAQLVDQLSLSEQRLAVELNGDILPRGEWPARQLRSADKIEIVRAIGGG